MSCTRSAGSPWPAPPGLTDPLPRGWHRLTWRRRAFLDGAPPFHVVSQEGPALTLLRLSLEADPYVVPGSITLESWSDHL